MSFVTTPAVAANCDAALDSESGTAHERYIVYTLGSTCRAKCVVIA
jgi:hypothetical protein